MKQQFQQVLSFLYFFEICCRNSNEELCEGGFKAINRIISISGPTYALTFELYGFTSIAFERLRKADKSIVPICHYLGEMFHMESISQSIIPSDMNDLLMNLLAVDSDIIIESILSLLKKCSETCYMMNILFENDACLIKYIIDLGNRESLGIRRQALETISAFFEVFQFEISSLFFMEPQKMIFFLNYLQSGDNDLILITLQCLQYLFIEMNNSEHALTQEMVASVVGDDTLDQALDELLDDIERTEVIDENACTIQVLIQTIRQSYNIAIE